MRKKTRLALFGLVLLGLVTCGMLILLTTIIFARNNPFIPYDDRKFDQALWESSQWNDPDTPRLQMVADLQRNYIEPGMTREQIVELLGEPGNNSEEVFIYGLGMSDARLYFLDVYFDSAGKLIETRITWD
jgi:hypothetical protein